MQLIQSVNKKFFKKVPNLKAGQTVRVHQRIKEGDKERTQIFEGLVIKVSSGSGTGKTFTVRKTFQGIGVEKIFPFHSPNVTQIEVVKTSKVRRAKLYYMRELTGKAARLKKKLLSAKDLEEMAKDTLEEIEEEVVAEETPENTEATEAPANEEKAEEPKAEATQDAPADENKEEAPEENATAKDSAPAAEGESDSAEPSAEDSPAPEEEA